MLSGLQSAALNFIVKSINENDLVPTLREIAEGTGYCLSSCRNATLELESLGYIRRREHRVRAISVLKLPEAA